MEEMIFKVTVVLGIAIAVIHRTRAVVISLDEDEAAAHVDPRDSLATSYMHFHGPVEGPAYEVKVPYVVLRSEYNHLTHGQDHRLENHGYALDYVAHPKYQFSYGVEDHHTGDFHGQKEFRNGHSVSGEYSIKEPGGTLRVVSYHADKDGFHAIVRTSGKNDHDSSAVYSSKNHVQHHVQDQVQHQVQDQIQDQDRDHGAETQEDNRSLGDYATTYSVGEVY